MIKDELQLKIEDYSKKCNDATSALNKLKDIDKIIEKIESIDISKDLGFNIKFAFLDDKEDYIKYLLTSVNKKRDSIVLECEKV